MNQASRRYSGDKVMAIQAFDWTGYYVEALTWLHGTFDRFACAKPLCDDDPNQVFASSCA